MEQRLFIFLGTERPQQSLQHFKPMDWRTLCQPMRRYANSVKTAEPLRAAAILIFCGAVEQNLIGLSTQPKHFRAMATVDYLRKWRLEA